MNKFIGILFFILSQFSASGTIIQIEVQDLPFFYPQYVQYKYYLFEVKMEHGLGSSIYFKRVNWENKLILETQIAIRPEMKVILEHPSYFPIELSGLSSNELDTIKFSTLRLIPNRRKRLSGKAICSNYFPRKKDIPKKIPIYIDGQKRYLRTKDKRIGKVKYQRK